jgi:PadR family transcriptional regulator PadR
MDTQFKKGLLDVCVLKCLSQGDSYGYKLINDVSKYIEVSESTLYPILKRLEEQGYLTTYKEEHNSRLRKYYKITSSGKKKHKELLKEIKKLHEAIELIEGGNEVE